MSSLPDYTRLAQKNPARLRRRGAHPGQRSPGQQVIRVDKHRYNLPWRSGEQPGAKRVGIRRRSGRYARGHGRSGGSDLAGYALALVEMPPAVADAATLQPL